MKMLKGDHLELLSPDPEKAMFNIFLCFLVTTELIFGGSDGKELPAMQETRFNL